jgi:hypothetical protein
MDLYCHFAQLELVRNLLGWASSDDDFSFAGRQGIEALGNELVLLTPRSIPACTASSNSCSRKGLVRNSIAPGFSGRSSKRGSFVAGGRTTATSRRA